MIYTDRIRDALKMCEEAHREQVDKGGVPYVFHPYHLAEQLTFEDEIIVALLHDVIEDHPSYIREVQRLCNNNNLFNEILALSRNSNQNKGKTYIDYIKGLSNHRVARRVKLLDLMHNLDETRLTISRSESTEDRYLKALQIMIEAQTDCGKDLAEFLAKTGAKCKKGEVVEEDGIKHRDILLDFGDYTTYLYLEVQSRTGKNLSQLKINTDCDLGFMAGKTKREFNRTNNRNLINLRAEEHPILKNGIDLRYRFDNAMPNRQITLGFNLNIDTLEIKDIEFEDMVGFACVKQWRMKLKNLNRTL